MTDNTVIIVVDQFAHNATVCYGGERICFSLSHMYGVELVEAIESRFLKSSVPFLIWMLLRTRR